MISTTSDLAGRKVRILKDSHMVRDGRGIIMTGDVGIVIGRTKELKNYLTDLGTRFVVRFGLSDYEFDRNEFELVARYDD